RPPWGRAARGSGVRASRSPGPVRPARSPGPSRSPGPVRPARSPGPVRPARTPAQHGHPPGSHARRRLLTPRGKNALRCRAATYMAAPAFLSPLSPHARAPGPRARTPHTPAPPARPARTPARPALPPARPARPHPPPVRTPPPPPRPAPPPARPHARAPGSPARPARTPAPPARPNACAPRPPGLRARTPHTPAPRSGGPRAPERRSQPFPSGTSSSADRYGTGRFAQADDAAVAVQRLDALSRHRVGLVPDPHGPRVLACSLMEPSPGGQVRPVWHGGVGVQLLSALPVLDHPRPARADQRVRPQEA